MTSQFANNSQIIQQILNGNNEVLQTLPIKGLINIKEAAKIEADTLRSTKSTLVTEIAVLDEQKLNTESSIVEKQNTLTKENVELEKVNQSLLTSINERTKQLQTLNQAVSGLSNSINYVSQDLGEAQKKVGELTYVITNTTNSVVKFKSTVDAGMSNISKNVSMVVNDGIKTIKHLATEEAKIDKKSTSLAAREAHIQTVANNLGVNLEKK